MISSIIDVILLAALAGTSGAVILMYRRLQRFDALQNAAAKEFARSSEALDRAREAMSRLSDDGGQMAITLAGRLNEARVLINDIEETTTRTRGTLIEMQDFEAELAQPRPQPAPIAATAPAAPIPAAAPAAPAHAAPAAVSPAEAQAASTATAAAPQTELVEILDEEEPQPRKAVPAAIRIRDAARARIAAARQKAVEQQAQGLPRAPRQAAATLPQAPLAASGPVPSERPVPTAPARPVQSAAPIAMGPFLPAQTPIQAPAEARPATAAATLARQRPTPNGPLMMLVNSGEAPTASAASATPTAARSAAARSAAAPSAAARPGTKSPDPADLEDANAAELESAMGTLTGRPVTWSDLASAARTA